MAKFPGFVGDTYVSQSPLADTEEAINLYVEQIESGRGRAEAALYSAPGYTLLATVNENRMRAAFAQDGRAFFVGGGHLYEVFDGGATTERGTLDADSSPAQIVSNGDAGGQLLIMSAGKGYCYDLTSDMLSEELTGVTHIGFLDGYGVALDADTSTLKISELSDFTQWDMGQVAQRSAGGDKWRAMAVSNRLIWLWGSQTSEVWYNAGTSPFPFQPIQEAFAEVGIAASYAFAKSDNTVMWIAESEQGIGVIYRADGYTPKRISTHAIEFAVQGFSTMDDVVGWSYQDQGHSFFLLNAPTARSTVVYDAVSGLWHKRGFWEVGRASYDAARAQCHCFAFGQHLVGDRQGGSIYAMSGDVATDVDGNGLRRLRRGPTLSLENQRFTLNKFALDVETGVGLTSGQGAAPMGMLRFSKDAGRTWGPERMRTLGAIGQFGTRVEWWRNGSFRQCTPEFVVSDPVPVRMLGASMEAA